jgi:hypothetical protein
MATTPRHASSARAAFPEPGVAASVQRAVAAVGKTGDGPVEPRELTRYAPAHATEEDCEVPEGSAVTADIMADAWAEPKKECGQR